MHLGWAGCRGEGLRFGGGGQSSGQVPPAHVKGKLGSDIASQPQKHPEGRRDTGVQGPGWDAVLGGAQIPRRKKGLRSQEVGLGEPRVG